MESRFIVRRDDLNKHFCDVTFNFELIRFLEKVRLSQLKEGDVEYTFNAKYKLNQTVWLVCMYDDGWVRTEKHKVIGYAYYPKNKDIRYFIDDGWSHAYHDWDVYGVYKDAKERCAILNKRD